jgi:hypothetical protein
MFCCGALQAPNRKGKKQVRHQIEHTADGGVNQLGIGQTGPLCIIHVRTQDNTNGEPWPPDGDGLWSVVRRERGLTVWRHISLK